MVGISIPRQVEPQPRQGGHQHLEMPTDERKLARGAVHQVITNPWSPPHNPSGDNFCRVYSVPEKFDHYFTPLTLLIMGGAIMTTDFFYRV